MAGQSLQKYDVRKYAGEVTRYMTRYLRDLIVVIFGEDGNSPPQHPVYWVGLAEDGSIVGLKSVVIWT